jgi:hypothetical protein
MEVKILLCLDFATFMTNYFALIATLFRKQAPKLALKFLFKCYKIHVSPF